MKKIVAAIDFSLVAMAVAEQAAALAEAFSAELILLHVAAPDPDFVGYAAGPQNERDDRASQVRGEHRDLQAMADDLRQRGIAVRALLIQGPAVEKILAEAEQLDADLIVIGSHGHGAVYRTLLGSVSEGVVHRATLPVLVIPSEDSADQGD